MSLQLETADPGKYVQIHEKDTSISDGVAFLFYATLDEVDSPYYQDKRYSNVTSAYLRMEIQFDDHPGEIGWHVKTEGGEMIMYRPPFYYFSRPPDFESFSVYAANTKYVLTVVDTYGDGLRQGGRYTLLTPDGKELAKSSFRDMTQEQKTFSFAAKDDDKSGALPTTTMMWKSVPYLAFTISVGMLLCFA